MARKRMISPTIWESAYDKGWTTDDFAVMVSAISSADDEGRGRISVMQRNLGNMISQKKFNKSLKNLDDSIKIYGKIYYFLPNWNFYQTVNKPQPSRIPEPKSFEDNDLGKNSTGMNQGTIHEKVRNDSRLSEVNLKEINISEVKGKEITHDLKDFFSLFHLTFNEEPTSQEMNQLSVLLKEYQNIVSFVDEYKIFKDLCRKIREGPHKNKTKAYLFGTFKLKLQDYCAAKSIDEAKKMNDSIKEIGEKWR